LFNVCPQAASLSSARRYCGPKGFPPLLAIMRGSTGYMGLASGWFQLSEDGFRTDPHTKSEYRRLTGLAAYALSFWVSIFHRIAGAML
jgi:hypothetical protein